MKITNELLLLIKQCVVLLSVSEELVGAFRSNLKVFCKTAVFLSLANLFLKIPIPVFEFFWKWWSLMVDIFTDGRYFRYFKFSVKDFLVNVSKSTIFANLFAFTKEILNGEFVQWLKRAKHLHFSGNSRIF